MPPQVPATNSISSISPQRRSNGQDNASPFARPTPRGFTYSQPLQSPQSYGFGENSYSSAGPGIQGTAPATAPPAVQQGRRLRDRNIPPSLSTRSSSGMVPRFQGFGILPTPDPTIASCISDEDVALQLMRLGDASNFSHGRTSASTMDETLSGRADVASSATDESDDQSDQTEQPSLPPPLGLKKPQTIPSLKPTESKKQRKLLENGLPSMDSGEPSGDEADEDYTYDEKKDAPDDLYDESGQVVKQKPNGSKQRNGSKASSISSSKNQSKVTKSRSNGNTKKGKPSLLSTAQIPQSPTSMPPQSRKASSASTVNFQHQSEEDLSTKPRCQRCRKSKKGCNRQRPCGRCKDAGIGAEGCISEDEGNGRKGRFGRHMGVSVKPDPQPLTQSHENEGAGEILNGMAAGQEKSKKRKR